MSDLDVTIAALRSDAKAWRNAGSDLADPKTAVEPLTLDGATDVMFIGAQRGIDETYERLRTKMDELMGQATKRWSRSPAHSKT